MNVDPGGSGCRSARLTIGLSSSPVSAFHSLESVEPLMSEGSYDGVETMPRILPVFGSIATAAPFLSPSALYAAFCTAGSIVVTTSPGSARLLVTVSRGFFRRVSVPSRMSL